MITVTRLASDGRTLVTGGEEQLGQPGLTWIDIQKADEATLAHLGKRFRIHKLAIEDCLHLDQRPKLEEYPFHHFLVLHGFSCQPEDPSELTLHEVHLVIGPDWLISVHELETAAVAHARRRMESDPPNTFARGVDFIAYAIADALVDLNFDVLDAYDTAIEDLEERIFEKPRSDQMERMFALKRGLVMLRKVLSPQRDVVALLTRAGHPFVQERTTLYFRDVYDHLIRLHEQIEAARDLLANARDAWLSATANRTGDVTKQLTIIATLFLPLSFVTGFFGQNFEVLSRPVFFWAMLGAMVAVPAGFVAWFRRRGWF